MSETDPLYKEIQITKIIAETHEAKSFEFIAKGDWNTNYQAGQFITLVFNNKGKEDRRSYSFSSAPVLNEPMRITVKRIANGEYSRHLIHHVSEGDVLNSSGISGFFKLPENFSDVKHFFFLAAGSGITPVYSLLKTLLYTTDTTVTLVYSNHNEKSTIFYKELLQLQLQFEERFKIQFLFSHINNIHKSRLSKWVLTELLVQFNIPLQETLFYMCGPVDYMLMAGITLVTAGVPQRNIKKEIFSTQKHHVKPVPPDTDKHEAELHINDHVYKLQVQYPDTILAAAKKQNIHLPYSCEAGNCGSCAATCTKGKVWMAYNEVLMDDEIAKGKILT
ncbi:MAG: iron-sulfur cluster-binding domain-containing protein, partial [Bacteroidota bacterium]